MQVLYELDVAGHGNWKKDEVKYDGQALSDNLRLQMLNIPWICKQPQTINHHKKLEPEIMWIQKYETNEDGNVCDDLHYAFPLCKEFVDMLLRNQSQNVVDEEVDVGYQ